ncbi:holo-ACP synthase [Lentibacillus cibarius]|uniref:Holo-[acyl-carrier-protein] synthase n=1 Tax=Lentibacillus cibarius TaxID=2583219 RepID=A0A5S3R6P5_9BACI|nr:holo-ACP synthase [Lentibacillus cibarius]TMN20873.1 holo-[acyl-carrier-protein] synthase [Lentibacillus cibarius]
MIIGIGQDLVELKRIGDGFRKGKKAFLNHILSESEQEMLFQFKTEKRQVEWLAGRFSAKEAFSKAIGTGFGGSIHLYDIEVYSDNLGKPEINFPTQINKLFPGDHTCHVSITHTQTTAGAMVIVEKI